MEAQTKKVYFIEETHNIEGTYVEINTLYVADDQDAAREAYEELLQEKPKKSFGLLLIEYIIQAESFVFNLLLKSWEKLPAEFYRKMAILNHQPLAEYQG